MRFNASSMFNYSQDIPVSYVYDNELHYGYVDSLTFKLKDQSVKLIPSSLFLIQFKLHQKYGGVLVLIIMVLNVPTNQNNL